MKPTTLIFVERIVPLTHAIDERLLETLPREDLRRHAQDLCGDLERIINKWGGPKLLEEIGRVPCLAAALSECAGAFRKECTRQRHVPVEYANEFVRGASPQELHEFLVFVQDAAGMAELLADEMSSRPDEDFQSAWRYVSKMPLTKQFVRRYDKHLCWEAIAATRQVPWRTLVQKYRDKRLSAAALSRYARLPSFWIDAHADELYWFEICEHQGLPTWLLRKHSSRLNWGQVSQFQKLTDRFICDNYNMLNHIKLEMNPHM